MRRMAIGAIALMVVLSACETRAIIEVNDDGSGTFGFAFGMEPLVFGTLPGGMDPLAEARRELREDGLPWEIEDFREPGLRGFKATIPFRNLDHLNEMLEQHAAARAGGGPFDADDGMALERRSGGGWTFRAAGNAPGADLGSPLGGGFGNPFGPGMDGPSFGADFGDPSMDFGGDFDFTPDFNLPSELDDVFRFEVHVTLPGDAEDHNAGQVRTAKGKSTFIWRLRLSDGDPGDLVASTTPAGGGLPLVPIALVLLVAAGGWGLLRRRGSSGPPPVVLEGLPPALTSSEPSGGASERVEPQPVAAGQGSLLDELGQGTETT